MSEALEIDTMRRRVLGRLAGAMAVGVGGGVSEPGHNRCRTAAQRPGPGRSRGPTIRCSNWVEFAHGQGARRCCELPRRRFGGDLSRGLIVRDTAVVIALGDQRSGQTRSARRSISSIRRQAQRPSRTRSSIPSRKDLGNDDWAMDRLLAKGAVVGACTVALTGVSHALAHNAGVSPEEATREWRANVVQGVTLLPSGVWGSTGHSAPDAATVSGREGFQVMLR